MAQQKTGSDRFIELKSVESITNEQKLTRRFDGAKQIVLEFEKWFMESKNFDLGHPIRDDVVYILRKNFSGETPQFFAEPEEILAALKKEVENLKENYSKNIFYSLFSKEKAFIEDSNKILNQNPDEKQLILEIELPPQKKKASLSKYSLSSGTPLAKFDQSQKIGVKQEPNKGEVQIVVTDFRLITSLSNALKKNLDIQVSYKIIEHILYVIELTDKEKQVIANFNKKGFEFKIEYNNENHVLKFGDFDALSSEFDYSFINMTPVQPMTQQDQDEDVEDSDYSDYSYDEFAEPINIDREDVPSTATPNTYLAYSTQENAGSAGNNPQSHWHTQTQSPDAVADIVAPERAPEEAAQPSNMGMRKQ